MLQNGIWFSGEYLLWWNKSADLPALATTSPANTPQNQAGVLGVAGTTVLFGGNGVDPGVRSGGRFTLGYWLCPECQETGIQATYLFLGDRSTAFNATNQNFPILAQPYFNIATAAQDSSIIAFPGAQTGSLNIRLGNELNSLDILLRRALVREEGYRLDYLLGYRYAHFAEGLAMERSTTFINPAGPVPVGTVRSGSELFSASNNFQGAELGVVSQSQRNRWSLDLQAKIALGGTNSRVAIQGTTTSTAPLQAPVTSQGDLFALPTNIGNYGQHNFSIIPEIGATLGFQLNPNLKATFGYSFLYWSQVARPGQQIDPNLNPTQFPPGVLVGAPSPHFNFATGDFWAQGMNFGLDCRF